MILQSAHIRNSTLKTIIIILFTFFFLECFHSKAQNSRIVPIMMQGANNHVEKFKLFETGFQMPPEIKTKIDNYLNNLPGEKLNPYNPDEINVSAIFNSSSNLNQTRFGFYYQDFERNYAYSINDGTGRFEPILTEQPWRIRFAPNELGAWTFRIYVYINGQYYTEIGGLSLWCDPSNEKGFLEVGTHKRQFRFSDTKTSFYALGQNIAWPDRSELLFDNGNAPSCQNLGLEEWKNSFEALGNHKANFARIILKNLEFVKLNDYHKDQNYLKILDEIINVCEQKDMYLDLCLLMHTGFKPGDPGYMGHYQETWGNNRYRIEFGLSNPIEFFTYPQAIANYKKRLRYIISRYGWSNHIAAFELVSELNNWGDYSRNPSTQLLANEWHSLIGNYLKNDLGTKQMLSTTFYGNPAESKYDYSPYDLRIMNFTSIHSYGDMRNHNLINQDNMRKMLNETLLKNGWNKPSGFSELGLGGKSRADVGDFSCCNSLTFHNHVWATSFMEGFGCGLNWWARADEIRMSNYDALHQFFSTVDFEQDSWTQNQHWVSGHEAQNENNNKLEVFAMTTNNSHKAMGWVHQATNWWGNTELNACTDRNGNHYYISDNDNDDECFASQEIYQEEFQITGLVPFKQYQFDFYRTDDGAGAYYSTQFITTNILGSARPLYPCNASANIYSFAFKAYKEGINEKNLYTIYPNPSNSYVVVESNNTNLKIIKIVDLLGKEILKINTSETKIEIDLQMFSSGIYFIVIQENGRYSNNKIVKQ